MVACSPRARDGKALPSCTAPATGGGAEEALQTPGTVGDRVPCGLQHPEGVCGSAWWPGSTVEGRGPRLPSSWGAAALLEKLLVPPPPTYAHSFSALRTHPRAKGLLFFEFLKCGGLGESPLSCTALCSCSFSLPRKAEECLEGISSQEVAVSTPVVQGKDDLVDCLTRGAAGLLQWALGPQICLQPTVS